MNNTLTSPWITPLRHPEFISGSRLWDAESSSAWRGSSVTLNSFQGLVFVSTSPWIYFRVSFWDAESSSAWRDSGSVTLNLFQGLVFFSTFQGLVFEMLNQVQHDEVVVSLRTSYFLLRSSLSFPQSLQASLIKGWNYETASSLRL